ncbi:MAG: carboxypeptidase-like regulatory domain-containing protein [Ginsengibacter sp.]
MILLFGCTSSYAQNLSKTITLAVNRQRLDNVLEILSNKGDFYFSYSSGVVKKDSLVSFIASNKTVGEILHLIFNNTYEFRESGNYIIIRKAPIRMIMVTEKTATEEKIYSVSGFVYDQHSGSVIHEASIYEKKSLASTLTNDNGYFKIRLKSSKASAIELTISKVSYIDTTVVVESRHNQNLTITLMPLEKEEQNVIITPQDYFHIDSIKINPAHNISLSNSIVKSDSTKVELTGMGRFLLSAKQKIQSLNLKNFFTTRPFQVSLIPGVGTHGKLSGQVTNNFSLNIFGGYAAGTNGLEIGGLFNIDKKEVNVLQVAGLFNIVGGQVKGLQVAGINNTVFDSVKGFQVAGINNFVKEKFTGLQVAGVANYARKKVSGVQVAGVINFSNTETDGLQIAGVFNYARKLKGVQIGLINIADTSEGYSIGLINIVLKGYHKLSLFTDEVVGMNAGFKTGNSKLYSILMAGLSAGTTSKIYSFGYGLGCEIPLNKRRNFSINPELTSQYLYLGSWDNTNILNKLHLGLTVKLNKYISVFAGPSYAVFISDQKAGITDYRFPIPSSGYKTQSLGSNVYGWFGWKAGINFF